MRSFVCYTVTTADSSQ